MTRWEYCELFWQPEQVAVTEMNPDGDHRVETYDAGDTQKLIAQLGTEGWELTGSMASPTGVHEYWYYFKRPVAS